MLGSGKRSKSGGNKSAFLSKGLMKSADNETKEALKELDVTCTPHPQRYFEDIPLVKFMYLVFTRMPGESYRRRFRSLLLYLCYVFRTLINSPACRFFEVQKVSRHLTGQLERSL